MAQNGQHLLVPSEFRRRLKSSNHRFISCYKGASRKCRSFTPWWGVKKKVCEKSQRSATVVFFKIVTEYRRTNTSINEKRSLRTVLHFEECLCVTLGDQNFDHDLEVTTEERLCLFFRWLYINSHFTLLEICALACAALSLSIRHSIREHSKTS